MGQWVLISEGPYKFLIGYGHLRHTGAFIISHLEHSGSGGVKSSTMELLAFQSAVMVRSAPAIIIAFSLKVFSRELRSGL